MTATTTKTKGTVWHIERSRSLWKKRPKRGRDFKKKVTHRVTWVKGCLSLKICNLINYMVILTGNHWLYIYISMFFRNSLNLLKHKGYYSTCVVILKWPVFSCSGAAHLRLADLNQWIVSCIWILLKVLKQ